MFQVRIKRVKVKGTPKCKEGETLSRPQTEMERTKWLRKVAPGRYGFHLGKKG